MQRLLRSAFSDDLVIYQIYPRSFQDTDGNGIGDLNGIISRLDYLKGLGITAIWLNPIFPSPMADFGYDVARYCAVDSLFGSMADLERLVKQAHKRRIRVVLDMVFNHTSEEHSWFKAARSSHNNPKRNWYVWRDAKPDGSPPNNWLSAFGGSAWEFDKKTGQYYLHSFLKQQPDLNWHNPEVRAALKKIVRFWLEKGVDGLRMDAVYYYAKDPDFRDDPINPNYKAGHDDPYSSLLHEHSIGHPDMYRYLNEIAAVLAGYRHRFMVLETSPTHPLDPRSYLGLYKHVNYFVAAPFNFETLFLPWKAESFRHHINTYEKDMRRGYVPVYVFGNHDKPRLASRYGPDVAPAAATLLLTLPGTPVIYYGEEIGMQNAIIKTGHTRDTFGKRVPGWGRDASRTPMQWSAVKNAGFTTGKPWLPLEQRFQTRNVEVGQADPGSLLNIYKELLTLRSSKILQRGSYEHINLHHNDLFGFAREYRRKKLTTIINFSAKKTLPIDERGEVIFSTLGAKHASDKLAPNEAIIISN